MDDRKVLNWIVGKFCTGSRQNVPQRYGPWTTLHTRFRRWAADGAFGPDTPGAQAKADATDDISIQRVALYCSPGDGERQRYRDHGQSRSGADLRRDSSTTHQTNEIPGMIISPAHNLHKIGQVA
ncbi:transposase [Streptomyces sp. NPDC049915]|uniref:transposase n=1 Tax=Streptomyces sp. NPDC049915 TaxID=3155510 RepID=UPI00341E22EC